MKVVTVEQMKQIEKNADLHGLSYLQMMENAGKAAYHAACRELAAQQYITVVAGKGNNGGDGFVIARCAAMDGKSVRVVLAEGIPVTPDAKTNFDRLADLSIQISTLDEINTLAPTDLVFDALYGTGFHGGLRPSGQKACQLINQSGAYIVALDLPSGTNADTGLAAPGSVKANLTVAFHAYKQVHVTQSADAYCGRTVLADIGIPDAF